MNLKPLLIAGIGLLLIKGSKKFAAAKNMRISLQDLPTIKIIGGSALFSVPVRIENLSDESFLIKKISAELIFNNVLIGIIQGVAPFTIAPRAVAVTELALNAGINNIITSLISALSTKSGQNQLYLEGEIISDVITVPIKLRKTF